MEDDHLNGGRLCLVCLGLISGFFSQTSHRRSFHHSRDVKITLRRPAPAGVGKSKKIAKRQASSLMLSKLRDSSPADGVATMDDEDEVRTEIPPPPVPADTAWGGDGGWTPETTNKTSSLPPARAGVGGGAWWTSSGAKW